MASSIEVNNEQLDLFSDDSFYINFQSNNIGQLSKQQVEYTNKFSIPKTPNNLRLLNNVHRPNDSAASPGEALEYKRNVVHMIVDGYLSLPKACLKIESSGSTIDISLQSGGAEFYILANNTKLNDPVSFDWSYLDIVWNNLETLMTNYTDSFKPIMVPMLGSVDMYRDTLGVNAGLNYDKLIVNELYPTVRVDEILNKIEQFTGYTIDRTNIPQNLAISLPKFGELDEYNRMILSASAAAEYDQPFFNGNPYAPFMMTNPYGNDSEGGWNGHRYTFQESGFYDIAFTCETRRNREDFNQENMGTFTVSMPNGTEFEWTRDGDNKPWVEYGVWYNEGDEVSIYGKWYNMGLFPENMDMKEATLTITRKDSKTYSVSEKIMDWTILDFVKEISRLTGTMITTDDIASEIRFTKLSDITSNKSYAINLENRAFTKEPKFTFEANGYAQTSRFLFDGDIPMEGILNVPNEWLEHDTEVWKSKSAGANYVDNMTWTSDADDGYVFCEVKNGAAGQMIYYMYAVAGNSGSGSDVGLLPEQLYQVYVAPNIQNNIHIYKYDWPTILLANYGEINQMLKNWLQVELELLLTSDEISNLQYLYPVYWDSQYWYINKISEYQTGRSCKLTLVRLSDGIGAPSSTSYVNLRFSVLPNQGKSGLIIMDKKVTISTQEAAEGTFEIYLNGLINTLPIDLNIGDELYIIRVSDSSKQVTVVYT